MAEEIIIRPARAEDMDEVCEIARVAWQPVFEEFRRRLGDELFGRLHSSWEQRKMNDVRQVFEQYPGCMLVTEVGGRVAAFVTYFFIDKAKGLGEISNNAVHPELQGRGLARKQYERVFEELRARGAEYVRVTTGLDDAHAPARRAYEAVGFGGELPVVTYYREL
ncbi:MAG: GNAT family N-acetyltransferase [Armatimonadia bacterium]